MTHRIGIGVFTAGTVGAKFTDVFAEIGGIDKAIDIKIGLFSM
jgi:hypothetical protein